MQRLVLQSGHGADTYGDTAFGAQWRSAEDAVRASGLEWTVLRPSNFAQNFDEENFHAPLVAGELALPAGEVLVVSGPLTDEGAVPTDTTAWVRLPGA